MADGVVPRIAPAGDLPVPPSLVGVGEPGGGSGSALAPDARSNDLANVTTGLNSAALPPSASAAGGSGQWVYLDRYSVNTAIDDAFNPARVEAGVAAAMQYVWKAGDTLRGLAQVYYGDANLWYVIAGANGVAEDNDVAAGTTLSIPSVTRSSNTASTFQVYNASQITGNTDPTPIPPPPPAGGGCGAIGTILVVIVAVVVTIYTAGAAAGAVASMMTGATASGAAVVAGSATASALGTAAAGALAAAAGSIASQGLAMTIGMQDKFSWKQVGLAAAGGAVTGGLNSIGNGNGLAATLNLAEKGSYASAAINAAASNVLTQGMAVATGLQRKFDWRAVGVSAVAGPLTKLIGEGTSNGLTDAFGSAGADFAQRMISGVVTQRIRMTVYNMGRVDYASIAADAFGNALGGSIVAEMQRSEAEQVALKTQRQIAAGGAEYFKRSLEGAGVSSEQAAAFAQSPEAQRLISTARALTAAQDSYGLPFDQLSREQKTEVLAALYRNPLAGEAAGAPVESVADPRVTSERVEITGKRYQPTLIDGVASVLDTGAQAVNRLVQAVGGEQVASTLVTGIQAAIYGVPKTAINLAVGELTEQPISYLTEKLSGLLQSSVLGGAGDAESVRSVSNALAGFAVNSVFDTGLGVVKSAGTYGGAKKAAHLGGIYEQQIRDLYPQARLNPREYQAAQRDGSLRVREADARIGTIDGKNTVVEAKFTKDWGGSIYNPNGKIGDKDFAMRRQADMLSQAQDYSRNFDQVIYHTNSAELRAHYNALFAQHGLTNIRFELTPFKQ